MDTLNAHDSEEFSAKDPIDSLSAAADEFESFAINMTTRDFLDDLGNISMGVQMTIAGEPTMETLRDVLSKALTVQECSASHKLPALAFISPDDIIALDQIVDCFHRLASETDLDVDQLTKRAEILIRAFDLLLSELKTEYVE